MKIINSSEFEGITKEGVVLVDFFATWCGPCKMLSPVLEELEGKFEGKATIVKVDVDQSSDLAGKFQVQAVPTMLLFKDGQVVETIQGYQAAPQLSAAIERHL